jgi:hypothetical protein
VEIRKANIIHSVKHQKFVASFPCVVCGNDTQVQACHIRSIPKVGNVGKGIRDCRFLIPMCFQHHSEQHLIGELEFFEKYNINPILISMKLASISPCIKINQAKQEGSYNGKLNYQEHIRNNKKSSLQS